MQTSSARIALTYFCVIFVLSTCSKYTNFIGSASVITSASAIATATASANGSASDASASAGVSAS